jgi:tetratricopeptide (TPR) repeat protein
MSEPLDQSFISYQRGRDLLKAGDLAGAISQFETSIAVSPHFKTLELLGEAFLHAGQPLRAVVPLAAATTLNAQVRAPSLLAEALLAAGDSLKAHEIAKLALERDASNTRARRVYDATREQYNTWSSQ